MLSVQLKHTEQYFPQCYVFIALDTISFLNFCHNRNYPIPFENFVAGGNIVPMEQLFHFDSMFLMHWK
jgi:hypothetical protein